MKHPTIALALFAGLAAPALAAPSNVELYGIIDAGLVHYTGINNGSGAATSQTGLNSGVESANRIGIKGSEDLGDGLRASFVVETGFCGTGLSQNQSVGQASAGPSGGFCTGGGFMQRESWVGLSGGAGSLRLGRDYTNIFREEITADPFGYGLGGSTNTLSFSGVQSAFAFNHANQVVEWFTPASHGLSATLTYSFAPMGGTVPGASPGVSLVSRAWSAAGDYTRGAFSAGLSYTRLTNDPLGLGAQGVNDGNLNVWTLRGGYAMRAARLTALYERATGDYARAATAGQPAGANTYWMLGASAPLGHGTLLLSYGQARADAHSVLLPATTEGTARRYAVGYRYPLSRRTDLYASYARMHNSTGTSFAEGSSTDVLTGVAGHDSSGIALGMRHLF